MRASTILRKLPFFLMAVVPLILAGCEGDQGPAGPQGPEGPQGPPGNDGVVSEYTYVGTAGTPCNHCHAAVVDNVLHTKHTHAFADLGDANNENPYCLQCHTTGWDSPIAYGQTEITEYGPDVNGYDDYWGVDTELAAERRADLAGVQCEACHGPMGPTFNDHAPPVLTMATVVGNNFPEDIVSPCYPCHSTQFSEDEYLVSGHGTVLDGDLAAFQAEFSGGGCNPCHTSEGFVKAKDPDYATWTPTEYNFIGCVTCHDPHQGAEGGGNASQLRSLGAVEVAYTFPYDPGDPEVARMDDGEYGPGNLCAQCHHGRRNTANVLGQIANGTAHFGPHESPQMDLFLGAGCYEIPGKSYDHTHSHQNIETACVQCHMRREVVLHGELQQHSFHSFAPNPGNCAECHGEIPDFDYHGVQTEIQGLMDDLANRFGYADAEAMLAEGTGWSSTAAGVTTWQREAAYALYFVHNDGSKGVHNPDYAMDLLNNAIAYYDENNPVN
jgi:hypothetical protein